MSILKISGAEEFQQKVLKSEEPVVVDFYADWCGPCQMLKPKMEHFSESVKIAGVNIDEASDLAEEYEVYSIPCLVKFEGGKEVDRAVGLLPGGKLKKFLGIE